MLKSNHELVIGEKVTISGKDYPNDNGSRLASGPLYPCANATGFT
jgi:hypothetical protein